MGDLVINIKKTIGDFFTYSLALSLSRVVGFILLPILTIYLSVSEFGLLNYFILFNSLIVILIGLGLDTILIQNFSYLKKDITAYLRICLILMALTSAAYFIVISSLSNVIPNVTSIEQYISITQYIIISIIVAFLFALNQIILTFHQYEKNPREILKIQIIISSIILLATLLFLITFEMNWLSRIYGIVIAYSIGLLYMSHRTGYKFLSGSGFHFEKYSGLLSQSLPIIISSLFVFLIMNIDKYFIEKIFGLYDFGLYAFGTSLNQLIFFIAVAMNKVAGPYLLDQIKLNNLRFIYIIISSISVLLVIVSLIYYYLIIFSYDYLFDQSYKSFFEFYSLQMIILVLLQVSSFFTFLITTQKRTYLLAFINTLFVFALVLTFSFLEYETISEFLEVYLITICIYIIVLNVLFYIPFRKSH